MVSPRGTPETKKCGLLPGSVAEHRVLANPMEDLVGRHRPWAHAVFHHYRRRFGRQYGSAREMEHRQRIFVHNMRYGHGGGPMGETPTLLGTRWAERCHPHPQVRALQEPRRALLLAGAEPPG